MASYGYRLFRFYLTEPYSSVELEFDDPRFGEDGARGALASAVGGLLTEIGEADERASTYLRVDKALTDGWVVSVQASGGAFGEAREVVDTTTHTSKTGITVSDAVLRDMLIFLVIPQYGTSGVLVSETRGRSHLTPPLIKRLNGRLKSDKLVIRLEANPADEVAWNDFLDQSDVEVNAIELIQNIPSNDRTRFGRAKIVTKASLMLKLTDDTKAKSKIVQELRKKFGKGQNAQLAGLVTTEFKDEDFDEQRVIYVQDGHEKRIKVASSWPAFIHVLQDESKKPDVGALLADSRDAVEALLTSLEIDRAQGWWPSETDLSDV